jgi:hypothetical protein
MNYVRAVLVSLFGVDFGFSFLENRGFGFGFSIATD